jgi:branched-subunit amino acid aminotransferase/4-amino-4-deoxychorismate lyase
MKNTFPFVSENLEIKRVGDLKFPVSDYGFLYGFGVFETILVHAGQAVLLHQHLMRLQFGAGVFEIPFDYDETQLAEAAKALLKKNDVESGILNIYITPGERPELGGQFEFDRPFLLMVVRPLGAIKQEINLCIREESFQRTRMDRFKTLSFMKNVLERRLAAKYDDVLLYNHAQELLETPTANVFFVQENRIVTPKSPVVMTGVVRQYLMDHQKELGVSVTERAVFLDELTDFDEIFLANSLRGIILVKSTEGFAHLVSGNISHGVKEYYLKKLNLV